MVNLEIYKSHRDKKLYDHIKGVVNNAKRLTSIKVAEVAAIFHDVGKINPHFQSKLLGKDGSGYSNHAYLSAYIFWCYYCKNNNIVNEKFNVRTTVDVLQVIILIAKHHGDLPNFIPANYDYSGNDSPLNDDEVVRLFEFISQTDIPAEEFTGFFLPTTSFNSLLKNKTVQSKLKDLGLSFDKKKNKSPLSFFLETQFAFASLILSDKMDAGNNQANDQSLIESFCRDYNSNLSEYLNSLNSTQNIPINKLRTDIRNEAVGNLSNNLNGHNRVFTLTAPTGSGKTLMLLSLAGEIIKQKGDFRIIYALPFLSITEQVEAEVLKIFNENAEAIQRIDSKSENTLFQQLQKEIENNPSDDKIHELLSVQFQEDTFAYPFVITTFVRFFETLLGNRNATLLKLPNFSKSVFLIDEIQALPPRLYSFFIAFLSEFCDRFDSYAIVSTATMPYVDLPTSASNYESIKELFSGFTKPIEISDQKYFFHQLFDRYNVQRQGDTISLGEIAELILNETESILVILNTIDDTKDLRNLLRDYMDKERLILLNTHFTPNDRKRKIRDAKEKLTKGDRIVLISTQLIEAGVDIDFPIVFRDMATMSSIIQSAGRCNRNGKLNLGKVLLFNLIKDGKERSGLIYRGRDKQLLSFTSSAFSKPNLIEPELFELQKKYFEEIGTKLEFGKHYQGNTDLDFVKEIQEAGFFNIGSFKLIDTDFYGEEFICYVPENTFDQSFSIVKKLASMQKDAFKRSIQEGMVIKAKIKDQMKNMSSQILQVRIKPQKDVKPLYEDKIFDIHLISRDYYSYEEGISLSYANAII